MISSKFCFSAILSAIWIFSLYYDFKYQPRLGHSWYFYKMVMLTNLNFVLCTLYSIIVLLSHLKFTKFRQMADFMFFTSIFPVATITCLLFWCLYYIDPQLVMPDFIAILIPPWLNHITHTYPLGFVAFDIILNRRHAPNNWQLFKISGALVFLYFTVIFYTRYFDGYWLYPILELFEIWHYSIIFVVSWIGFFLLTKFATLLSSLLNRNSKIHHTHRRTKQH